MIFLLTLRQKPFRDISSGGNNNEKTYYRTMRRSSVNRMLGNTCGLFGQKRRIGYVRSSHPHFRNLYSNEISDMHPIGNENGILRLPRAGHRRNSSSGTRAGRTALSGIILRQGGLPIYRAGRRTLVYRSNGNARLHRGRIYRLRMRMRRKLYRKRSRRHRAPLVGMERQGSRNLYRKRQRVPLL